MSLADQDVGKTPSKSDRWVVPIVTAVAALAGIALLIFLGMFLIKSLSHTGGHSKKPKTIKIVVPDTPPPPPPPKKDEEQPKEAKEVKAQQKQEQKVPQEAPLKMDGPAGDAPSALQAGNVTSDYAGGNVSTGASGPAGGPVVGNRLGFAFYTRIVQRHVQEGLARDPKVKGDDYRVVVRIWLTPDGVVQRVELDDTTGDDATDANLRAALSKLPPMRERPPENMPQPIRLRISNRLTG